MGKKIATPDPMSRRPGTRAGDFARWTEPVLTMGRTLRMGGSAWQYLVDAVAGEVGQGGDAARYYASAGTPPGRFLGRGLDGLGPSPGSVKEGDVVSPEMLRPRQGLDGCLQRSAQLPSPAEARRVAVRRCRARGRGHKGRRRDQLRLGGRGGRGRRGAPRLSLGWQDHLDQWPRPQRVVEAAGAFF